MESEEGWAFRRQLHIVSLETAVIRHTDRVKDRMPGDLRGAPSEHAVGQEMCLSVRKDFQKFRKEDAVLISRLRIELDNRETRELQILRKRLRCECQAFCSLL